jgi:hypothetical protein
MAKNRPWFRKGSDALKYVAEDNKRQEQRRKTSGLQRWWIERGTTEKLTFLDNPEMVILEHGIRGDDNRFDFLTCIKEFDDCPACQVDPRPSLVLMATVISHKSYTNSAGKTITNQKMLLALKSKARDKVLRQMEKRGGSLRFCCFEVTRGTGTNDPATGDDFEFIKKLKPSELAGLKPKDYKGTAEEYLTPLDYEKILAPMKPKEMRVFLGLAAPIGTDEEDDDEETVHKSSKPKKGKAQVKAVDDEEDQDDDDDDDDDDGEEEETKKVSKKGKATKGKAKAKDEDEEDDDEEESVGAEDEDDDEEEEEERKPVKGKKPKGKSKTPSVEDLL